MKFLNKINLNLRQFKVSNISFKAFAELFKDFGIRTKMTLATGAISLAVIFLLIFAVNLGRKLAVKKSFSLHATSYNEMKKRSIERYFDLVKNQSITMSENNMVINAMANFKESFKQKLNQEDNFEINEIKSSLESFYSQNFLPKYNQTVSKKLDVTDFFPKDNLSIYFQHQFIISNNTSSLYSNQKELNEVSSYVDYHNYYHQKITNFAHEFDYNNIYLIDPETGYIVYSVEKNIDFATSLKYGKFSNSNLSKLFEKTKHTAQKGSFNIVDFDQYPPSYSQPQSFVASPIFKDRKLIGILAFQLPSKVVNSLLYNSSELTTNENNKGWDSYIVGADYKLKNKPSSFINNPLQYCNSLIENGIETEIVDKIKNNGTCVQNLEIKTEDAIEAINGETGNSRTYNIAGKEVFSAYTPLTIEGLNWALISEKDYKGIAKKLDGILYSLLYMSLIFFVIATIISMLIGNSIIKPLLKLKEDLEPISKGDLTIDVKVNSKDEIGQAAMALKNMTEKLRFVIGNVMESAESISLASSEMNISSMQMSEGANEQASSAEEISASMQQMAVNIKQNTENSKETENIAKTAAIEIKTGSEKVFKTLGAMEDIIKKISIIDEIAKQTNLLAVTASIEAARAGDHGKGFAVRAVELTRLTGIGHTAATEIEKVSVASLISAKNSGKLLNEIVPSIEKTSQLVQEISAASIEQDSGANQINNAVQQLNQVVQQNAAISEQMAASSEELSAQAEHLKDLIQFFKINTKNISLNHSKEEEEIEDVIKPKEEKPVINIEEVVDDAESQGIELDMGTSNNWDELDDEYEKF